MNKYQFMSIMPQQFQNYVTGHKTCMKKYILWKLLHNRQKNMYFIVHHAKELLLPIWVHTEENACFGYSVSQNYIQI
jgi:hypothetical protein